MYYWNEHLNIKNMREYSYPIEIRIHRYIQDAFQTEGVCTVFIYGHPVFSSISLERGWQGNLRNISCMPLGTYDIVKEFSPKFKTDLWEVKKVPNRAEIKFHPANFWRELEGCIALGVRFENLDNDKYYDALSSTITLDNFHKVLAPYTKAKIIVTGEPGIF